MDDLQVLLAEDDPSNACLAREILAELSCRVTVVVDGAAALSAALQERFDLILMDCRMPVMDGLAATRSLATVERALGRAHTPVVAVTASAMKHELQLCVEAGMDDILTKPYAVDDLERMVERWGCRAGPGCHTAQNDEAARLSRELHDGAGQMLVSIKLLLESAVEDLQREHGTAPGALLKALSWLQEASTVAS